MCYHCQGSFETPGVRIMSSKSVDTLDLRQFFPYRLSVLQERVSEAIAQHYRSEYDLGRVEWRVLATLAMFDKVSAKDVCEFTQMAKMQVSRAIARLRENGLLRRRVSAADQRAMQLSLTPAGWRTYRRILPRVRQQEREILGHLSAAEQGQLLRILAKLEAAIT